MRFISKILIVVLLTTLIVDIAHSQSRRKKRKILFNSEYNYEAVCIGVGVDGTKLLKVYGYGRKVEDAINNAKKRAVAACIFKGAPGKNKVDPIITQSGKEVEFADYFDRFFKHGGKYLEFIALSGDGVPSGKDRIRIKKGYKVGIAISVMYDKLRKELENNKIVPKLGQLETVDKNNKVVSGKKPTIMVVPSDNWCVTNGYVIKRTVNGQERQYPDYRKALLNDSDLLMAVAKINTLMADRGFPLKNLESVLKKLETEDAEMAMLSSKDSGSALAESPIDILRRTAKADIIMQLTYKVNKSGAKNSVTFNLQGLDAYTDKQIAGAQGTGQPSFSAEVPLLIEEAVLAHLDNFNTRLNGYFQDLMENGREVTIKVKVWESSEFDLTEEFEYDGEESELREILDDWMGDNTVKGSFSNAGATSNNVTFEQVRIPIFYERKGKLRPMDAYKFAKKIRKLLKKEPFSVDCKLYQKGLGEVWIIVGEK